MKKLVKLLGIAFYFSLCLSCRTNSKTQELSIVVDDTEKYFPHFSINEVRKISCISRNEWNGEKIRINCITELGFNKVRNFSIDKVDNRLYANEFDRRQDTARYFNNIDSVIAEFSHDRQTRNGSVIYKTVAEELDRLSKSKADKKVMVINSDMFENSWISFYNPTTMDSLRFGSKEMERTFYNMYPFGDLTNVDIYLIYQPQNVEDSKRFEIVSGFYKSFFERHHAKVFIKTSLN